jgi:hypothetical protein
MADVLGSGTGEADEYDDELDDGWDDRPGLISSDALALTAFVAAILSLVTNLPASVAGTAFRSFNTSRQGLRHVEVGIAFASAVAATAAAMLAVSVLRRDDLSPRMRTVAGAAVVLGTTGLVVWLILAFAMGLYTPKNQVGVFTP